MKKTLFTKMGTLILSGAVLTIAAEAASIHPTDLRCEYMRDPLGMDLQSPRLFWKVEADKQNARALSQSAFQIQVASCPKLLEANDANLWDTGIVPSNRTTQIEYAGMPLDYPMHCFWRVRVADQDGEWSDWSSTAQWVMGPMEMGDWTASWIGSDKIFDPKGDFKPGMSNPWLRKTYDLAAVPDEAMFHVASVGFHELYVNGKKVGDEVLAPHVSDLKKMHTRYKTYDIAPYLKPGKNAVVLWLGVGWAGFPEFNVEGRPRTPMAMAQADLFYFNKDGVQSIRWATDPTWKQHESPSYLIGGWIWHQFGGDYYDASKEVYGMKDGLPEWGLPDLDDADWKAATVFTPNMRVTAERLPGNIVRPEAIKAVSTEMLTNGVVRVDMGKNFNGWTTMKLHGEPGKEVTMTWSERTDIDCSFGMRSGYVFGKTGEGTFTHHFNYNCGRWIYITGLDYLPEASDFEGHIVTTDMERVGNFNCDNDLLNLIYDTTIHTFDCLSVSGFIVDCSTRERLGYGGDGNATLNTGISTYDMAGFYNKWAEDFRDIQDMETGRLLHTAPTYIGGGGPTWSGFIIAMPWEIYLQYGDTRILEECYPNMKLWLKFLEANSKDNLIVPWGEFWDKLGDWLPPGTTGGGTEEENQCLNDCYWVYNLETAASIADIIGYPEDAKTYRARAAEVRKAANAKYFDAAKGTYGSGRQAYQATALLGNVPVDANARLATLNHLVTDIQQKQHIDAGITGGAFLFRALMNEGRSDLIFPMVNRTEYPGWGDMIINRGHTTIIENWDESEGHTRCHSSYLYVGYWFQEGLGGIKTTKRPGGNGFQHFVITPGYIPGADLHKVESSYNSLQGKIVSNWEVVDNVMTCNVTVPVNCTAEMTFPTTPDNVLESGKSLILAKGVKVNNDGVTLSSGTYTFTVELDK